MFILYPFILLALIGAGYLVWRRYLCVSYATWPLFYQMFAKWMVITIICGGYSFFLGVMISGFRLIPMMAAMVITAAALAFVESRGRMGDIKARFPLLKCAMRYGTRFRLFWALWLIPAQIMAQINSGIKGWVILPSISDAWIGMVVIELFKIIGFNIEKLEGGVRAGVKVVYPEWIAQLGIFGISLTTATIHVMILGLMTLLIWAGLSVFYRAIGRHRRT